MSSQRWAAAALIVLGLGAAGCTATPAASDVPQEKPAKVESIQGKSVKSVTLTEQAVKRVGVETTTVATADTGTVVPYQAVLYTPDGNTWVYAVTGPRQYAREQVTIANVGGNAGTDAFLSAGPAAGTTIVKTGLIELYGAELGVGK
ncbi:hypothetical protein FXN61_32700 [Lentzea sp. PSKA42]|uniref:Lipoprotein n=1 Tax=Lentzea indica TaxID=2604800 RepID=A0ABX1FRZ5_9PSEU|nr:hypothetical protein [Lentzea indica]NKE61273.1 hypothetical protein [Lentzea indica]